MKLIYSFSLIAVCALTCAANAQEAAKKCPACPASDAKLVAVSTEDGESCDTCKTCKAGEKCEACQKEGCPVSAAMAKLPKMTYQVGTESTCCSKSAAEMAEKTGTAIHYVVAEKTFEDQQKAYVALVETTESFVDAYVTPKTCSVSGKTTVAGKDCACSVEAGKRSELVNTALKDIKMTYKVGDKETCCSQSAAELAKKSGAETTYVVNGEACGCSYKARLNLALAKYQAVAKALAAADAPVKQAANAATQKSGT